MQSAALIDHPLERRQASIVFTPSLQLNAVPMRFGRDEEIYGAGESADSVYRVISGAVRVCAFDADGRRQIEDFYMPGDLFGFESASQHRFSAEAICDCEIALVRRAALARAAATDREAAVALWTATAAMLVRANEHLLLLGKKRAIDRVFAFLLQMAERAVGDVVDLPMSRTEIADYLGLTIETVSRSFSSLERQGAIALDGARHVMLKGAAMRMAA